MSRFGGGFDLAEKQTRLNELEKKSHEPDFWNDTRLAGQVTREMTRLKETLSEWKRLDEELGDLEATLELRQESPDPELEVEAREKIERSQKDIAEIEFHQMLSGEHDSKNAILSINAGAGGTESCDWAERLLRMYRMWADKKGFRNEVVDFTPGDQAGFRSVTITVEGSYAYGYLKAEIGVHRLVRISPFDANKRRHTSFASVFVIPDVEEEVDIEIKETDLRVDTFRSSGAGGQKVNKTDSAVRLTHLPTGIVVACQNERSQHRNRATAMKLLKARLYELEMKKKQEARDRVEAGKAAINFGSQIRSYVLHPYRLVKDHRTDFEVGNADSVLDGEIDPFVRRFLLSTPPRSGGVKPPVP
ncbi:MAG: peptide chain release factor 2 [Deltaproteobacteria bacterium]|nr:peptide chain release factor 2 [Deltaproteobacteria bacterium]